MFINLFFNNEALSGYQGHESYQTALTYDEAREIANEAQIAADDAAEGLGVYEDANADAQEVLNDKQETFDNAQEAHNDAFTKANEARNERDQKQEEKESLLEEAQEAKNEMQDAVDKANEAAQIANDAINAHDNAVREKNDRIEAVNNATQAVYDAMNNEGSDDDVEALRTNLANAQANLDEFEHDLDALNAARQMYTDLANDAAYEIYREGGLRDQFEAAVNAVNDAVRELNALEAAYHDAQSDVYNAANDFNAAINALNIAKEAAHNASQDLAQAQAHADYLQNVADVKESNAQLVKLFEQQREAYENDRQAHEDAKNEWENGLYGEDYENALREWEKQMRDRDIALEDYEAAQQEYQAARQRYEEELEAYNQARRDHQDQLDRWEEWENNRPTDQNGNPTGEGIVVEIEHGVNPNFSGGNHTNISWEIAPGIILTRGSGGNSAVFLTITEEAEQGQLTFYARHGNSAQRVTIDVFEAGDLINLSVHPNFNMSQFSNREGFVFESREMPVFNGQAPTFEGSPPELEHTPPPTRPVYRGDAPEAPKLPELELAGRPEFNFERDDFTGGVENVEANPAQDANVHEMPDFGFEYEIAQIITPDTPDILDNIDLDITPPTTTPDEVTTPPTTQPTTPPTTTPAQPTEPTQPTIPQPTEPITPPTTEPIIPPTTPPAQIVMPEENEVEDNDFINLPDLLVPLATPPRFESAPAPEGIFDADFSYEDFINLNDFGVPLASFEQTEQYITLGPVADSPAWDTSFMPQTGLEHHTGILTIGVLAAGCIASIAIHSIYRLFKMRDLD